MTTHSFIQIYPQGRILIEAPAAIVGPVRYRRSCLKQRLREHFVSGDEDGTLVWWRWVGSGPAIVELDFPKDRFSMDFLRKTAKKLEKLFRELELVERVKVCEMDRAFYTH